MTRKDAAREAIVIASLALFPDSATICFGKREIEGLAEAVRDYRAILAEADAIANRLADFTR